MTPEARVIGYDLRIGVEHGGHDWDLARRERYLLRPDVDHPLSVDPMVWPQRYDESSWPDDARRWATASKTFLGLFDNTDTLTAIRDGIEAGAFEGESTFIAISSNPSTWSDVQRQAWDKLVSVPQGSAWTDAGLRELEAKRIVSTERETGWSFLGFDVADAYLLSGLSNCGLSSEKEDERLAPIWAGHLNDHHLFQDENQAVAFSKTLDERVPEHAPFYAYGLWQVPQGTSA